MEVIVTKLFTRDVDKELNKLLQLQLTVIIEQIRNVGALQQIPNIKKLTDYKTAYRIKIGAYRICLFMTTIRLS